MQSLKKLTVPIVVTLVLSGCSAPVRNAPSPPPIEENQAVGEPVDIGATNQMIDEAAQAISVALPSRPEVRDSKFRLVLAIAPFEVGGFSSPVRFRSALESVQTKLMENRAITDSFRVVSVSAGDANAILKDVAGGELSDFDGPGARQAGSSSAAKYNPADIYTLTGKFYQTQSDSAGRRDYRLFVKVEHPQRRETVYTYEFRRTFRWDGKGAWQQENP